MLCYLGYALLILMLLAALFGLYCIGIKERSFVIPFVMLVAAVAVASLGELANYLIGKCQ